MSRKMCAPSKKVGYTFNPTAGIPKASYNEKSRPDPENITWFSTIQPPKNKQETPPLEFEDAN